ncbi:MAG TPA: hypothetical protein VGG46_04005 [Terriglobales bacterium]
MNQSAQIIEIPQSTKVLPCSGCGRECMAGKNSVMVFCRDCSAKMGVKK